MKNNIKPPDLTNNPRLEDGIGGKRLFLSDEDFQKEAEKGYNFKENYPDDAKRYYNIIKSFKSFSSEKDALCYLIKHPEFNEYGFCFRVWAETKKLGTRFVYSGKYLADLGTGYPACMFLGYDLLFNNLSNFTEADIKNLIPKKRDR